MSVKSWGGSVTKYEGNTYGPAYPYNTGLPMPSCRTAANGDAPIRVNSVSIDWKSGSGREEIVYDGRAASGVDYFDDSSGTFVFRILRTAGQLFFGRDSSSGTTYWSDGGSLTGLMPGSFDYDEVPSAPTSLSAAGDDGSVALNWSAPSSNGGSAITGYLVEWATNSGFTSGKGSKSTTDSVTIVSGLSDDTTYYFRVFAKNAVATAASTTSVKSSTASARTNTTPSAPRSLAVSGGSNSAVVSWISPADDGGTAVTGYLLEWATNSSFTAGAGSKNLGVVTSDTVTGLTPGLTYYFRVRAKNAIGNGTVAGYVSTKLGGVPSAPLSVTAAAKPGLVGITWATPSTDNGVAITGYLVEYATDPSFSTNLVGVSQASTVRGYSVDGLAPATNYYFRVKAVNSVGTGAASSTAATSTPARSTLDGVQGAAVSLSGGVHVEIRSDGAASPTLTLGYITLGVDTTFVAIGVLPTGSDASSFAVNDNPRGIALIADPDGNLFVIGRRGDNPNVVFLFRYERTGATSWNYLGANRQALPSTGNGIGSFAATYVPGVGGSPVPTVLIVARRIGWLGLGAVSFATIDLSAPVGGGGTDLFSAYGSDPSWLSTPPNGAQHDSGTVAVAPLVKGGTRLVVAANGFAVIDVINGVIGGVSKSSNGTALTTPWAQVIGVSASAFALVAVESGAIVWRFYGTNGAALGSGVMVAGNAWGGAFTRQWGAFYDSASQVVVTYFLASNAGSRTLKRFNVSPTTYSDLGLVTLSTEHGPESSANGELRVPLGSVDERRVIVETANLSGGAKSIAAYSDRSGNIAPNAPALTTTAGFDGTQPKTFAWAFSDANSLDSQSAYELIIERVSDGAAIVSTGKVISTTASRVIAGGTLANGTNYRWRARTYDQLDAVGAWSPYDTFTASALGVITITSPAADNPAGVEVSSYPVAWSYAQADGYVQTQRRVKVVRVSDSATLSDTTMQASTVATYTVTGIPTDVEVRIEVSIVTNAPSTPTVTASRLLTSSYGTPMAPLISLEKGESYIVISAENPEPTGSRPEVVANYIDRREATGGDTFSVIARIDKDGSYQDHAVKSSTDYEYRLRGATE